MKTAVILMNLGTPTEATKPAVREFLKEFLSDPRVVEIPKILWMIILYCFILTFRVPKVTKAYKEIWQDGSSPLRLTVESQVEKLQQYLNTHSGSNNIPDIHHAMAYSGPSINDKVVELEQQGFEHFLVLPLYPQFSATTTGSIYDQVSLIGSKRRDIPQIHIIKQYFNHPLYIKALANSVNKQWDENGKPDRLLMSFHSIPQAYSDAGDPYYHQCVTTAELLAEELQLSEKQWALSFQSRLGYSKWLSPYTFKVLTQWGEEKVPHVDVICPAFSADCLETLEEIQVENRDLFLAAGGRKLNLIPCLNDQPQHIEMMAALVNQYLPKSQ
jgi:ferrochelatase